MEKNKLLIEELSKMKNLMNYMEGKKIIKEDVLTMSDTESDFLNKVKNENPEMYGKFFNLVRNKGLDFAKEKYFQFDKERLSSELKSQKDELEKQKHINKLKLIYKKLKSYWDKAYKANPDDFDAIQWGIEFDGGEEYMLKQIEDILKKNPYAFDYLNRGRY